MPRSGVSEVGFLSALLHGRRSRLAEAERLERMCRLARLSDLGQARYPQTEFRVAADFQRRLTQDLVSEITGFLKHVEGTDAGLLMWLLTRFQVENLKVLLRGLMGPNHSPPPQGSLVSLPPSLALNMKGLLAADSPEQFARLLPLGRPRKSFEEALSTFGEPPRTFLLEGALDRGYLEELLTRAARLSSEDREAIQPVMRQEAEAFHLTLVLRGRFHYGLSMEALLPLRVRGSGTPSERFRAMLAASDVLGAARLALGRAIDSLPPDSGTGDEPKGIDARSVEALISGRFLRLSNLAFRRGHMGLGAVVGYIGIRRVEVANLITLSEGIVRGMPAENLSARMLPRRALGAMYA